MAVVKGLVAALGAAVVYVLLTLIWSIGTASGWRLRSNTAIGVGGIRAMMTSPIVVGIGVAFVVLSFLWQFQRSSR